MSKTVKPARQKGSRIGIAARIYAALGVLTVLTIAASLVVNDSPNDVLTAGLLGYVTVEAVMLRARCAARTSSPGSSPGSSSSLSPAVPRRP